MRKSLHVPHQEKHEHCEISNQDFQKPKSSVSGALGAQLTCSLYKTTDKRNICKNAYGTNKRNRLGIVQLKLRS